jgi:hypothetical protein
MVAAPLTRQALFAAMLAVAVIALACSSSGTSPTPTNTQPPGSTVEPSTPAAGETPATTAEEAIQRYVQNRLIQGFVADCSKAKRPDDVGKQCAKLLGKRGDLRAYALGPTFSDPTRTLVLKPENGDWTLLYIQNIDANSPPGIPWPLEVGAQVVVAGTAPDCLKIRVAPGTGSEQTDCINDGLTATVVAGPVQQDDIEWWQLEGRGWVAGDYLRYPDQVPAATATP